MNSGVRRQIFTNTKKFLLQEETFEKDKCKRLFKEIKVGKRVYYNFQDENIKITNEDKNKYEILGYMLAASLRDYYEKQPLFLNFNPLIYKIMINGCKLENENGENILTYDDLQYFDKETYNSYCKGDEHMNTEIEGVTIKELIEERYNSMITSFKNQLPKIEIFYNNFRYFLNVKGFDLFEYFSIDEFLKLKEFLEGTTDITYEDIKDAIEFSDSNTYNKNKLFKNSFLNIFKSFSSKEIRNFILLVTGSETILYKKAITIFLTNDYFYYDSNTKIPFIISTCGIYLNVSIKYFTEEGKEEEEEKICNKIHETLKQYIATCEYGDEFNKS
jgi:hypothetical protein